MIVFFDVVVYTCISLLLYSELLFTTLDVLYQDPETDYHDREKKDPGRWYRSEEARS